MEFGPGATDACTVSPAPLCISKVQPSQTELGLQSQTGGADLAMHHPGSLYTSDLNTLLLMPKGRKKKRKKQLEENSEKFDHIVAVSSIWFLLHCAMETAYEEQESI